MSKANEVQMNYKVIDEAMQLKFEYGLSNN